MKFAPPDLTVPVSGIFPFLPYQNPAFKKKLGKGILYLAGMGESKREQKKYFFF